MYRIGEFSRITGLTVKALRYYDEAGILVPSGRDGDNGYRIYSGEDYRKAELIRLLRGLDFSIGEIRDALVGAGNRAELRVYLLEKKAQIKSRIKRYDELLLTIDRFIEKPEQEEKEMQYQIEEKTYAPLTVASIRYSGKYSDTGAYFGKLCARVKSGAAGTPFCRYHDPEYKEDGADIEVCIPVREPVEGNGVQSQRLPGVKVIATTHIGPYETIHEAYKALTDYANGKGIALKSVCRETYHKGPGMIFKGDPNKYVTEVAFEIG